ncbi:hypothetical protein J2752_000324 [Halarchaeum rubridurum]|uniref:DUF7123 domain-containing protein n=1 Tax=Halarchaeum rubridurum TaxID=489911 RepID=A0A830FV78_9EURY|nr:hypothetical protein [Halarchaeum rubridurum]MBP1953443.1 hypothetical protein [Halarchaeum rubridurum]GGM65247.1 hypothetical protein GCM10009017_14150 [Halarchaeum rubridurum]
MSSIDVRRNQAVARLERHLGERLDAGPFYCKSKDLAADLPLSASQIGQFLGRFDGERTGVVAERWGYSNGTRWYVHAADENDDDDGA